MARRGENIYKRRDGRWEGRYVVGRTPSGRTRFGYVYGRQYQQVRRALLAIKAQRLSASSPGAPRVTLSAWFSRYMDQDVLPRVKPSTAQAYRNLIRRHILPPLGPMFLADVTARDVRAMLDGMLARGLSPSTARGALRLLSSAMRAAQDAGLLLRNPCHGVRLAAIPREQRVLTRAEQERIRRAGEKSQSPAALLALYTGLRLGEICALRWEDVDFARGTLLVRRTAQRVSCAGEGRRTTLLVGPPKSRAARRTLPLAPFLLDALRRLPRHPGGYVFSASPQPAEPRTIQRQFAQLMARLRIPGAHFHSLRHTFATRLLELHVDVKTVSVLLGHAAAQTTLSVYAHSLPSQQRAAIRKLAAC